MKKITIFVLMVLMTNFVVGLENAGKVEPGSGASDIIEVDVPQTLGVTGVAAVPVLISETEVEAITVLPAVPELFEEPIAVLPNLPSEDVPPVQMPIDDDRVIPLPNKPVTSTIKVKLIHWIPMNMQVTTSVANSGEIVEEKPWWAFLAR